MRLIFIQVASYSVVVMSLTVRVGLGLPSNQRPPVFCFITCFRRTFTKTHTIFKNDNPSCEGWSRMDSK